MTGAAAVGAGARLRTQLVLLPRRALLLCVRIWQLVVSPWYPPTCRFYPSCSAYAVQALLEHGAVRGTWLAVRRLLRCHPWNPGGVDHVPSRDAEHPGRPRGQPGAGGPVVADPTRHVSR